MTPCLLFQWAKRNKKAIEDSVDSRGSSKQNAQILIPSSTTVTPVANILPAQKTALVKTTISFKEISQKYHYMACKCRFEVTLIDSSGAITATMFGEVNEKILGSTAKEVMNQTMTQAQVDNAKAALTRKEFYIQVKVPKRKEGEPQQ